MKRHVCSERLDGEAVPGDFCHWRFWEIADCNWQANIRRRSLHYTSRTHPLLCVYVGPTVCLQDMWITLSESANLIFSFSQNRIGTPSTLSPYINTTAVIPFLTHFMRDLGKSLLVDAVIRLNKWRLLEQASTYLVQTRHLGPPTVWRKALHGRNMISPTVAFASLRENAVW